MLIVFSAVCPDSYSVVSSISRYIVGMIRHSHQLSNGASAGLRHYFVFATKPQFGVKRPCSTKARLGGENKRCDVSPIQNNGKKLTFYRGFSLGFFEIIFCPTSWFILKQLDNFGSLSNC